MDPKGSGLGMAAGLMRDSEPWRCSRIPIVLRSIWCLRGVKTI